MGLAKAGLAAASFTNAFLSMVHTFQCDYDERYCISEYAMRVFRAASKAPDSALG